MAEIKEVIDYGKVITIYIKSSAGINNLLVMKDRESLEIPKTVGKDGKYTNFTTWTPSAESMMLGYQWLAEYQAGKVKPGYLKPKAKPEAKTVASEKTPVIKETASI